MSATRLLLSMTALELLRRRVLPEPLRLPPGFAPASDAPVAVRSAALAAAEDALRSAGVLATDGPGPHAVHPAIATDLQVLAQPELAVVVRARRPGLDVTGCVAVRGDRGAGLLRTSTTAVQLSAFLAADLADELARVVPAPPATAAGRTAETVPLDALLPGAAGASAGPALGRLRATRAGALHASVAAGARPDREGGVVGAVEWVLDAGGWVGLAARPSRAGRPQVALVPVVPADLPSWVAPLAGAALG